MTEIKQDIHIARPDNVSSSKNRLELPRADAELSTNESHARLTTETTTDLLEKVVITNDIVIAWPIRLSGVRVMDQDSAVSAMLKPDASQPDSERPEVSKKPTVSMSLHLDGLVGKQNVNIHTRVRIKSPSPERDLTVASKQEAGQLSLPLSSPPPIPETEQNLRSKLLDEVQVIHEIKIGKTDDSSPRGKQEITLRNTVQTPGDDSGASKGELVGGQALVCPEYPHQLLQSTQAASSPIDLKVDDVGNNTDDSVALKLEQLESISSRESDEVASAFKQDSVTPLQPMVSIQSADEADNQEATTQPKIVPSIPGMTESIPPSEIDDFVQAEQTMSANILMQEGVDEPHQSDVLPANAQLNMEDFRSVSLCSIPSDPLEFVGQFETKASYEDGDPVIASTPGIQHPLDTRAQIQAHQGAEEKLLDVKADLGPEYMASTELEEPNHASTVQRSVRTDVEMGKSDKTSEPGHIRAFYLKKVPNDAISMDRATTDVVQDLVEGVLNKTRMRILTGSEESAVSTTTPAETLSYDKPGRPVSEPSSVDRRSEISEVKTTEKLMEPSGTDEPEQQAVVKPPLETDEPRQQLLEPPTPAAAVRDVEVDVKLQDDRQFSDDGEHEESEWSQSTHRVHYRHYRRYHHPGDRMPLPGSKSPGQRRVSHSRVTSHFSQGHRRSRTVPRPDTLGCDHEGCMDARNLQVSGGLHSEDTSSDSQTSETSEIQKITMVLLNTLTTTAELLRKQYKRRKVNAGNKKKPPPLDTGEAVVRNASCAVVPFERKRRSRTMDRYDEKLMKQTCAHECQCRKTIVNGCPMVVLEAFAHGRRWRSRKPTGRMKHYPDLSQPQVLQLTYSEVLIHEVVEQDAPDHGTTVQELCVEEDRRFDEEATLASSDRRISNETSTSLSLWHSNGPEPVPPVSCCESDEATVENSTEYDYTECETRCCFSDDLTKCSVSPQARTSSKQHPNKRARCPVEGDQSTNE